MAEFNEILSARYNRLLQKLLSMKGAAPAPQLSGDISAEIALETDRPEWGFLSGTYLFSQYVQKAADVANLSAVGVFNGQSTGALVVITGLVLVNGAAGANLFVIRRGVTTGMSGVARAPANDDRWLNKVSVAQFGSLVEAAATGTQCGAVQVPANSSIYLPVNHILRPNDGISPVPNLMVESAVVNVQIAAMFMGYERQLEASEVAAGSA